MIPAHLLPTPLREAIYRWWGFRPVLLGGRQVRVLPNDRRFWDGVSAGTWEPATIAALRSILRSRSNYCDIGAWIGPTVLFARECGAEVTCFEPDPLAYERLLGNLRLNGAFDVRAFPCAIGARDGIRTMGAMVGSLGKSATSLLGTNAAQTVEVPCLSWGTAISLFELPLFDMIKIDVEGGEVELLPSMMQYLRERKPALLLSTHWSFLDNAARNSLCESLAKLAGIYRKAQALGGREGAIADLADPATPSRHSVFLLEP